MLLSASIAMVLCVCNRTQSEPFPRAAVVEEFTRWRRDLLSGFHVIYNMKRKIVHESGPYDYVPGGTVKKEHKLKLHLGGEHAWRDVFRRDITVLNPEPGDFEMQCMKPAFSFKGRMVAVSHHRRAASIEESGRNTANPEFLPEEELFLEVLGFESILQDRCVTLRGYKNPHKFDVLKDITSPDYSMTSSTIPTAPESKLQRLYRFELPGVDSFTLSEAYGYAMIKRKWIWPEGSNGKGAFVEIENTNWKKVNDTVWIPFTSQIRFFAKPTPGSSPEFVLEETITVSAASTQTPDKLFLPKLRNGATIDVSEGRISRQVATFRGNEPEDFLRYLLDPIGSEHEDQVNSAKDVSERGRLLGRTRFFVLISASVLLLAAIVFRIWYYRKARRQER